MSQFYPDREKLGLQLLKDRGRANKNDSSTPPRARYKMHRNTEGPMTEATRPRAIAVVECVASDESRNQQIQALSHPDNLVRRTPRVCNSCHGWMHLLAKTFNRLAQTFMSTGTLLISFDKPFRSIKFQFSQLFLFLIISQFSIILSSF